MNLQKVSSAKSEGLAVAINKLLHKVQGVRLYGAHPKTGLPTKSLRDAPYEVIGRVLGAPVRAIGSVGEGILHGPKIRFGPMAGTRGRLVRGPGGVTPITKKEYEAVMRGDIKGDVLRVPHGFGHVHFKRNYEKGGLIGMAQRHPVGTGAAALGGLLLLAKPSLRPLATGMIPEVPENSISPEVQAEAEKPVSTNSPLAKTTWG